MHQNANIFECPRAVPSEHHKALILETVDWQCVICERKINKLVYYKGDYVQATLVWARFDEAMIFPICKICDLILGKKSFKLLEEARRYVWNRMQKLRDKGML